MVDVYEVRRGVVTSPFFSSSLKNKNRASRSTHLAICHAVPVMGEGKEGREQVALNLKESR